MRAWGWSLHEWNWCPYNRQRELTAALGSAVWSYNWKAAVCSLDEAKTWCAGILISDFQPPEWWEISITYKLPSLWYFVRSGPSWTKQALSFRNTFWAVANEQLWFLGFVFYSCLEMKEMGCGLGIGETSLAWLTHFETEDFLGGPVVEIHLAMQSTQVLIPGQGTNSPLQRN